MIKDWGQQLVMSLSKGWEVRCNEGKKHLNIGDLEFKYFSRWALPLVLPLLYSLVWGELTNSLLDSLIYFYLVTSPHL